MTAKSLETLDVMSAYLFETLVCHVSLISANIGMSCQLICFKHCYVISAYLFQALVCHVNLFGANIGMSCQLIRL